LVSSFGRLNRVDGRTERMRWFSQPWRRLATASEVWRRWAWRVTVDADGHYSFAAPLWRRSLPRSETWERATARDL